MKKLDLLKLFSSETEIGIVNLPYEDEDDAIHEQGEEVELTPFLPGDFGQMAICTNCARYIVDKVGSGDVYGFFVDDNPVSSVEIESAGGHDFAVIDGRYIVDIWISHYTGEEEQYVYDLHDHRDKQKIIEIFGDPDKWSLLTPIGDALESVVPHEDKKIGFKNTVVSSSEFAL